MIRVVVKNLSGVVTHAASFETQELADVWIAEQKAKGRRCPWGSTAYSATIPKLDAEGNHAFEIVYEPVLDKRGNQIKDTRGNPVFSELKTYLYEDVSYPDQFTIEFKDISSETQLNEALLQLRKNRNFGNQLVDKFAIENVSLGIDAATSDAVLSALFPTLTALSNGYLETGIRRAKELDPGTFDGKFLSVPRILQYVNAIESYLGIPLSRNLT